MKQGVCSIYNYTSAYKIIPPSTHGEGILVDVIGGGGGWKGEEKNGENVKKREKGGKIKVKL